MASRGGSVGFSGKLTTKVIRAPGPGLVWKLRNLPNLLKGWRLPLTQLFGMPGFYGSLHARLIKADGRVINYGLISVRAVTTAFCAFLVAQLQTETSVIGDFKFHDSGVGVTGAAVGDTDIETTDGETRPTGSQVEGASAVIYKSIGTIAYTTTKAITEHGLFSIVTGGTMMDHHVFSALNVVNGDSIEFTYNLTCTAGG